MTRAPENGEAPQSAASDAHAETGQRGHNVFHHLDRCTAMTEHGAPGNFNPVTYVRRNAHRLRKIRPHEDNA